MHTRWTVNLAILLLACMAAPAGACQIPVFRYALEKWQPDAYQLYVAHRGELSEADKLIVEQLERTVREQNDSLNLVVSVVDLAQKKEPVLEFLLGKKTNSIESPRLILVYPFHQTHSEFGEDLPKAVAGRTAAPPGQTPAPPGRTTSPPSLTAVPPGLAACPTGTCDFNLAPPRLAWSGDLTAEHARHVIESPVRKQIAERLLSGQSSVWVLLESNDDAKNAAAFAKLEASLAEMQRTLKLPAREAIEADEFFEPETKVDLRIEFSILRIPFQRAAEEAIFATTLLHADAEVAGNDEPVAISVFGRGRSYFALVGDDINAEAVEEHCRFLVGDCSCRVKRENPGTDLLFAVAWDDSIRGSSFSEKPLPELSGIGLIGANQGFPAASPAASKSTEVEVAQHEADDAGQPAIVAQADASLITPVPSTAISDSEAQSPQSVAPLAWIFGLAALGLLAVLAGTFWLRFGKQS